MELLVIVLCEKRWGFEVSGLVVIEREWEIVEEEDVIEVVEDRG